MRQVPTSEKKKRIRPASGGGWEVIDVPSPVHGGGAYAGSGRRRRQRPSFPGHLYQGAQRVLQETGRPMKPREVMDAISALGWPIKQLPRATDAVRTAMGRKADVFARLEDGRYALVAWEARRRA